MKKIFSLIFCLFFVMLIFSACGQNEIPTVEIADYTSSATATAENHEAKFNIKASKDGMYSFTLEKKNADEWDFKFYILDESNEKITGNLLIHSTEWAGRNVFLPKGNYTLVAFGDEVDKKITMYADVVNYFEDNEVVLTQTSDIQAPVALGFTALERDEKSVKITLDGTQSRLSFNAFGTGAYYDNSQQFTLKIIDKNGNESFVSPDSVLQDNVYEGNYIVDVKDAVGEYTAYISANDNCTVTITIE